MILQVCDTDKDAGEISRKQLFSRNSGAGPPNSVYDEATSEEQFPLGDNDKLITQSEQHTFWEITSRMPGHNTTPAHQSSVSSL